MYYGIARRAWLTSDDDIFGTKFRDLLLGVMADTLTHGYQPDDGGRTNEDAQRG